MFSMSWGSGSRRRPAGPVANVIKLVAGTALVVFMGVSIGPALSAAQGHGTRGYFVAQAESCGRHGCTWSGKFRLPDGQVTRGGVNFDGGYSGMHVGSVVPALDTGAFSGVFPRHGSDDWLTDLAAGVFGIGIIGRTIWAWAKRRRGAFGGPAGSEYPSADATGSGGASSPAPMVTP